MKEYIKPKTQVVWVRLLGSCLEDEPMNIGTKPMKVEDSDAKKWEGFTDDDEDLAFTKNAWND